MSPSSASHEWLGIVPQTTVPPNHTPLSLLSRIPALRRNCLISRIYDRRLFTL